MTLAVRRILLALAIVFVAAPAYTAESVPAASARATVALVSETDSYRPGHAFRLGLRFRIAPGWHIYWQNPGDAGSPPDVAWTLPDGAKVGGIEWPAPERDQEGPVTSYIYTGELVLPVAIAPPSGDAPFTAQADANWLICQKVCIPEEGHFRLVLPPGTAQPADSASLFAAADERRPQPNPFSASVLPDGRLTVAGQGLSKARVQGAWFFPAAWGEIDQNAPQPLELRDGSLTLRLKPGAQFSSGQTLTGVLALRDPGGNESFLSLSAPPGAPGPAAVPLPGLVQALLLAFAGGLILNLMPCVLPVLTMKALAVVRLSGREQATVRRHGLSYAAGAMMAFLALGGLLLAVRAAGQGAGWGFQFQSPVFVTSLAWLLFGIGLNFSGVFEIGGRVAGVGRGVAERGGHPGSFFTGLLAVAAATPCTAPFMGSAVAAALASPPALALGIFAALGTGFALPAIVLAAAPRCARLLPRPGAWMDVLRQALAFPMYGTAIWLLWVVSQEAGPPGVLTAAGGMGLLGLCGWAAGQAQRTERWGRRAGYGLAAAALILALALLPRLGTTSGSSAAEADGTRSEPFSAAKLATLRSEGRPVFVDMTAAWCVTCLVNEQVALAPRDVQAAFAAHHVAYLKGDWTRQDREVTAFLHAAGREGVPLYVYYPAHGDPVVLPQILTPGIVLAELQKVES
jgi:thiol:disulfide interchange protein DsbD